MQETFAFKKSRICWPYERI